MKGHSIRNNFLFWENKKTEMILRGSHKQVPANLGWLLVECSYAYALATYVNLIRDMERKLRRKHRPIRDPLSGKFV